MPHRDNPPNAGGKRCVCMSKMAVSATIRAVSLRTSSSRLNVFPDERSWSVNEGLPVVAGIGPAGIRHEWRPARAARILIVPVVAHLAVELRVFRELLPVEFYTKAGAVGNAHRPALVLQLPALDDVVNEVVIVRVGRKREVRDDSSEMQHRRQLNAELARRMHGDPELERFAHAGGFDARTDAAPEGGVEENHVNRAIENVGRELLEVDDDGVGGERDAEPFARVSHPRETEHWILQIVVIQVFDGAPEPDRLLGRPDGVRIEAEAVAGKCRRQRPIALQVVFERKHATFELVGAKPVLRLQRARESHDLLRGANGSLAAPVRVAVEQIRRKRHAIADAPAENVTYRHAPRLAE